MGYYMKQRDASFFIKKKNIKPALKALHDLFKEKGGLAWVNANNVINAKNFTDAMGECRWGISGDLDGEVSAIYFNGEKLGDDEFIFKAIAPCVESGSFIEMEGEDSLIWRWVFDNGKMIERIGNVVFC